jgi:hypothetical protein
MRKIQTKQYKKSQVIPDDGFADGGERYTNDEMNLLGQGDVTVESISASLTDLVDELSHGQVDLDSAAVTLKRLAAEAEKQAGIDRDREFSEYQSDSLR